MNENRHRLDKKYRVLLEASGSLTSGYLIDGVKQAGAIAVASDIAECFARHIADDFLIFPKSNDPHLWDITEQKILGAGINVVVPSLDETLHEWSLRKNYFAERKVNVVCSDPEVIAICQDKWKTFEFFQSAGIPTPQTSLDYEFPLVKPRLGRGGKGILVNADKDSFSMQGMIAQELLIGIEYTVDVFCDREGFPVYIIPRIRQHVKEGKSLNGVTVNNKKIIDGVEEICRRLKFIGPVNFQCFEVEGSGIKFTEINPRIGGGMALGFAASENWFSLIISNLIEGKSIQPKPVKFGLQMFRYYAEVFVSKN